VIATSNYSTSLNDNLAKKFIRAFWSPDAFNGGLQHGLSIIASVCFYFLQAFVNSAWQLILLQALSGLAIGGMIPSLNALMNCHAPSGSQGATYGLNASITAAGRSIAPLLGATIAMWFGMRSVFVVAAAIYGLAVLVVLFISRTEYIKTAS